METLDSASEFLRITERYRQMSDSELLVLIPQSSQLTPHAQQALASEVRSRGLKLEDEEASTAPKPEPQSTFSSHEPWRSVDASRRDAPVHDAPVLIDPLRIDPVTLAPLYDNASDSYDEDRELVEVCTVWSLADARQVQSLLDRAGIPFFMGTEKATCADAVTSSFVNGVSVQVMRIGLHWAAQVMQYYEPANEPPRKQEEPAEIAVRCPECNSLEVILEDVISEMAGEVKSSAKYRWSCDSCENQWENDGTVAS